MTISSVIAFPEFVNIYIRLGYPILEDASRKFAEAITKYDVEKISFGGRTKFFINDIRDDDFDVINFLTIYSSLCDLDSGYRCLYEDELKIAKSSERELFSIVYNQVYYVVRIESFEKGILELLAM